MVLWKVSCLENKFPGMWQRWFKHQCVGIGWPPMHGYHLEGKTKGGHGWKRARKALKELARNDQILVTLRGHRVGRIGTVVDTAVGDDEWDPLVPTSKRLKFGDMGRRILVRWDMTAGPDDRDLIVRLPNESRLTPGELRPTIARVRSLSIKRLIRVMNDRRYWEGLVGHFSYEKALSDFIAAYPHHLEDGLLPHPDERVRERVFGDRSRADVLLTGRGDAPIIVECKQGSPTLANVEQIRGYMKRLLKETGKVARGILVHGGSRNLPRNVARAASRNPKIEIIQYSLKVDFAPCR